MPSTTRSLAKNLVVVIGVVVVGVVGDGDVFEKSLT
jgi:hypothetical protein